MRVENARSHTNLPCEFTPSVAGGSVGSEVPPPAGPGVADDAGEPGNPGGGGPRAPGAAGAADAAEVGAAEEAGEAAEALGATGAAGAAGQPGGGGAAGAPGDGVAAPANLVEAPVLLLPGLVVMPGMTAPLHVTQARALRAIGDAVRSGKGVLLLFPRPPEEAEDPRFPEELRPEESVGLLAHIERIAPAEEGGQQVIVEGVSRVRILRKTQDEPYYRAAALPVEVEEELTPAVQEKMNRLVAAIELYVELTPGIPSGIATYIRGLTSPGQLADHVAFVPELDFARRYALLAELDPLARLERATQYMQEQVERAQIRAHLREEVKASVEQQQRRHLLRQQMEAIRKELGEEDPEMAVINELREKLKASGMGPEVLAKAERELNRLEHYGLHSPESGVIRSYVEWLAELPWDRRTTDQMDLAQAARILDEDHYGLEKVKERILEYIAVRHLAGRNLRSPILCFVGPPGVGKTSLGRSIARALGRQFVRASLGGIHDEAEIRGHRRTYVGALPGRIIQGIRNAGTKNPVFMLDEVDKVGVDFRGDPAAALLEVLDPEQNFAFSDHYLEVPFDLSETFFITTANVLDTIPPALLDRMEVIRIPGYTEDEKVEIARRFLIPQAVRENGLESAGGLEVEEGAVRRIIREYTREAGVRGLQRELARIARKRARQVVEEGASEAGVVRAEDLTALLGPPKLLLPQTVEEDTVGVAAGVAVTEAGGEVLYVEAAVMPGKGNLTLTGQLGQVMQESAQAAYTYCRSHAAELGIPVARFERINVHIHVPAGAVPKDGPSAGVAMVTALASVLTGRPVRHEVAMTGEITLRGKVLGVGGIKEKVLAAHRAGLKVFLLPEANRVELDELPAQVREEIQVRTVSSVEEVLAATLLPARAKGRASGHGQSQREGQRESQGQGQRQRRKRKEDRERATA
ncbi:MAG TPA: endopeptidase La [Firmicutes bacterium]|nr:endopeptidase La [Bacillota bacterium]